MKVVRARGHIIGPVTSPADPRAGRGAPPVDGPESELPSVGARVLAFLAILVGGAAGGAIGYAFADLGGFEGFGAGAVTLLAALVGAGGVAVVAVLTLRAHGEWRTIRREQGDPGGGRRGGAR